MPTWVRAVLVVLVALAVVALLFTVVFPWVESRVLTDPVLGG